VNPDYAIFVFPRPWIWLGLAVSLVILALNLWIGWRHRQVRLRVAHIAEPLVDICRRHGFPDEAEQIQADVDRLRRGFLGRRRAARRDAQRAKEAAA